MMSLVDINNEILECARYGEDDDLRALLHAGGFVDHQDVDGNTGLHKDWAVQNAQLGAAKFILDNFDVDVLGKNSYGRSALTDAFQSGNSELIDLCLSHPSSNEENLLRTEPVPEGQENSDSSAAANAVTHKMNFGQDGVETEGTILTVRELPITRADNPFGSATVPEDDTTGMCLWPASLLLSRWALKMRPLWEGKVVLELGAGCGLPALSTAVYGNPAEVYITDVHGPALRNAVHNVLLNGFSTLQIDNSDAAVLTPPVPPIENETGDMDVVEDGTGNEKNKDDDEMMTVSAGMGQSTFATEKFHSATRGSPTATTPTRTVAVTVSWVSWEDESSYPHAGQFVDVLLGSDLVYDAAAAKLLAFVSGNVLKTGGSFLYVAPDTGRAGMDNIIGALAERNIVCKDQTPCPDEFYENPLCSGDSDADQFLLHFHELTIKIPFTLYHFVKL